MWSSIKSIRVPTSALLALTAAIVIITTIRSLSEVVVQRPQTVNLGPVQNLPPGFHLEGYPTVQISEFDRVATLAAAWQRRLILIVGASALLGLGAYAVWYKSRRRRTCPRCRSGRVAKFCSNCGARIPLPPKPIDGTRRVEMFAAACTALVVVGLVGFGVVVTKSKSNVSSVDGRPPQGAPFEPDVIRLLPKRQSIDLGPVAKSQAPPATRGRTSLGSVNTVKSREIPFDAPLSKADAPDFIPDFIPAQPKESLPALPPGFKKDAAPTPPPGFVPAPSPNSSVLLVNTRVKAVVSLMIRDGSQVPAGHLGTVVKIGDRKDGSQCYYVQWDGKSFDPE